MHPVMSIASVGHVISCDDEAHRGPARVQQASRRPAFAGPRVCTLATLQWWQRSTRIVLRFAVFLRGAAIGTNPIKTYINSC